MNILIIGCGKVGSKLATTLAQQGHDIVIVDSDSDNFRLLSQDFNGYTISGVPIDQDILRQAGIESCDVVATVTPEDNVNLMVSQVAKTIFNIEHVITRIYDQDKEQTFSKLGLKTICPINLTVSAICSSINNEIDNKTLSFGTSTISFSTIKVPKKYIDKHISEIDKISNDEEMLFGVIRDNSTIVLNKNINLKLKESDQLIFSKIID